MGIFLPEKVLTGVLAAGLARIKEDLDLYMPDIFSAKVLGEQYLAKAAEFLGARKITITQGYPLDDQRLPGWFVVPATSQEIEDFIGEYIVDEELDGVEEGGEIKGKLNSYSVKIITASTNGDVTLMLDAIARYILLLARESLSELNMNELTIQSTDFDPIYQFLPETFQMRSAIVSFKGMDSWVERYRLIQDVKLYVRFNPNEDYIEVS